MFVFLFSKINDLEKPTDYFPSGFAAEYEVNFAPFDVNSYEYDGIAPIANG